MLLVSDRANIVPARMLRGGMPVISTGRGDGTVDIRPLEVGRNPFKRGDIIVTSGTGGLYPPLVPIARVVRLDDDGAIALPLADPGQASFAIVEPPFEPAALAVAATRRRATADGPRGAPDSRRASTADRARASTIIPAASVVAASLLWPSCRSSPTAAGGPTSASSC